MSSVARQAGCGNVGCSGRQDKAALVTTRDFTLDGEGLID